ncbi:MAG: response regulator [Pyrinomonadaceae bacterium]
MFIDDERRRMKLYVEELESNGHEVLFRDNVDSALETLNDLAEHFDLIVLDISMPPGKAFAFEDTIGGSRTGLALYATIRSLQPDLPIVALTNVADRRVADRLQGEDARLCRLVRKPETLPFQFAELVEEFSSSVATDFEN